jgi:hypothetical protein
MAKRKDFYALALLGPKCPMQRNNHVTEKWCELVQYDEICRGCKRNRKRKVDHYQMDKK